MSAEADPAALFAGGFTLAAILSAAKPQAGPEPIMVDAAQVGLLLTLSERQVHRMDAAGELPAPVRPGRGRAVRWLTETLKKWAELGCPSREEFEQRMKVSRS
jgi:predicted DNA-binding transcriptional regulator AlpA